jgi:drug/metabolite transporter (DMT)-like permease
VHWTAPLAVAMTWNVLVMSVFGMAIYNTMMDRYGAARAASGFFIVPGASALIAWALIDEHLRPIALIGLTCATIGVALVWWKSRAI